MKCEFAQYAKYVEFAETYKSKPNQTYFTKIAKPNHYSLPNLPNQTY